MGALFRLAHISDLHFSAGAQNPGQRHSIPHLQALEKRLKQETFDRLIVSGDISHRGDVDSLRNAHTWLTAAIPLTGEEQTGLRLSDPHILAVVPGNHDAWNAATDHSLTRRWQRSLENYNSVFSRHAFTAPGVRYDWIQREGVGIYIAYVDSCYLGSSVKDFDDTFGDFNAIAKGEVTTMQSRELLSFYDRGVRGKLPVPGKEGATGEPPFIDRAVFAKSLKILVMHHFLFDPKGARKKRLMKVKQQEEVFRNVALADFDLLLCGHSHLADVHFTRYGDEFDDRATSRYIMNRLRRDLGIASMPVQYTLNGRPFSRRGSMMANVVWRSLRRQLGGKNQPKSTGHAFVEFLRRALKDPNDLGVRLVEFIHEYPGVEEELPPHELQEIAALLKGCFTEAERRSLITVADQLADLAEEVRVRPFIQYMNGSACKATTTGRKRCFNVYSIERRQPTGWMVQCDEYAWDPYTGDFSKKPTTRNQSFR